MIGPNMRKEAMTQSDKYIAFKAAHETITRSA